MGKTQIVVSSEHSGNKIPKYFKDAFKGADQKLKSHWGFDIGVSYLAEEISKSLNSKLYQTIYSRLLVDCNRGLHRDDLFSEISNGFDPNTKKEILKNYYYPHRNKVERFVSNVDLENMVLHLSIHTFTPIWKGKERLVDIGILFDEIRSNEKALCTNWIVELQKLLPNYQIRHNEPYEGAPDGLTAHLRKLFPDEDYMGIEIEVNQKYANTDELSLIGEALISALKCSLSNLDYSIHNQLNVE